MLELINKTDRFCRLSCLFLGSDNLFLYEEIRELLEVCLRDLLSTGDDLNFDQTIEGEQIYNV